jgi:regulator of cell morphogenesis and NO signaling
VNHVPAAVDDDGGKAMTTTRPIAPDSTLADLVIEVPGRARVLEGAGLDYCCAGAHTLAGACAEAQLDLAEVTAALEHVEASNDRPPRSIAALVDHLLDTHHRYLHENLPRLAELATKVLRVHGERHSDLATLHATVFELQADLEPHLMKEELVLFPACRALDSADGPIDFPFGTTSNPVRMLMREHDTTGALLARLELHLDQHPLPDDACASYAALYASVRELVQDTHDHVFKENHLLFPAIIERERELANTAQPSSGRPGRDQADEGGEAPCFALLLDDAGVDGQALEDGEPSSCASR